MVSEFHGVQMATQNYTTLLHVISTLTVILAIVPHSTAWMECTQNGNFGVNKQVIKTCNCDYYSCVYYPNLKTWFAYPQKCHVPTGSIETAYFDETSKACKLKAAEEVATDTVSNEADVPLNGIPLGKPKPPPKPPVNEAELPINNIPLGNPKPPPKPPINEAELPINNIPLGNPKPPPKPPINEAELPINNIPLGNPNPPSKVPIHDADLPVNNIPLGNPEKPPGKKKPYAMKTTKKIIPLGLPQ